MRTVYQQQYRFRLNRLLRVGGHRRPGCDCSAPKYWSVSDGGYVKACLKGQSCVHLVGLLIGEMRRAQWSPERAYAELMLEAHVSGAWLRTHNDPERVFEEFWEGSWDISLMHIKPKRRVRKFVHHRSSMVKLLQYITDNPDSCTSEIRNALRDSWRGGGRVVQSYLDEARRMGFVQSTRNGRRVEHRVVAWPTLPVRPENGHLTFVQCMAWVRAYNMSYEQFIRHFYRDWQWDERFRKKRKARKAYFAQKHAEQQALDMVEALLAA